jgi:hypothetical protein
MKAAEHAHEDTLLGTLRLRMATCGTLAKPSGLSIREKALAAFISQTKRYFDFQTTKKRERVFDGFSGKPTRSTYNPLNFAMRFGSGNRSRCVTT